MSVEARRAELIAAEERASEIREALEDARRTVEASYKAIAAAEREAQEVRTRITLARTNLTREETLAASAERADRMEEGIEKLVAKFEAIAHDKVWYTGTGNDDVILPHQWQGMMFGAVAERWLLADGVGLGKTRTAVGWLDLREAKKVILVCEANICNQFAGEVMELAPHRTLVNLYKRAPIKRRELIDNLMSMDEAVVVVNFEMFRKDKDALALLMSWQADTVIIDEAHNLKSTATANYKNMKMLIAVDNKCPRCGELIYGLWDNAALPRKVARPCDGCGWKKDTTGKGPKRFGNKLDEILSSRSVKNICLTTGTPILNSPEDLYSLLHLINPALFPNLEGFKKLYLQRHVHSGKWEFARGSLDEMKPLIEGVFLARNREDAGVVLPPQTVHVMPVELDRNEYPAQYRAIRQISQQAQLVLDSGAALTIMHLIALITRKRQANVWPGGIVVVDKDEDSPTFGQITFDASEITESVKMDAVISKIVELAPRRQVVFSQFKTALAELEIRLTAAGLRVVRFDGDTPKALREEVKSNFNRRMGEEPRWDVVLANYKTGGTGLNFTAITATHILDEEWNPGKRNQAYGRSNRMGQTEENEVFVWRIPGTIDTWMSNTIQRKEQLIDGFTETMVGSTMEDDLRTALTNGSIL